MLHGQGSHVKLRANRAEGSAPATAKSQRKRHTDSVSLQLYDHYLLWDKVLKQPYNCQLNRAKSTKEVWYMESKRGRGLFACLLCTFPFLFFCSHTAENPGLIPKSHCEALWELTLFPLFLACEHWCCPWFYQWHGHKAINSSNSQQSLAVYALLPQFTRLDGLTMSIRLRLDVPFPIQVIKQACWKSVGSRCFCENH